MPDPIPFADRIPLATLAAELGVTPKTVTRWTDIGYDTHRLFSFRLGKKRYTTRQAADQFLMAINGNQAGALGPGCC